MTRQGRRRRGLLKRKFKETEEQMKEINYIRDLHLRKNLKDVVEIQSCLPPEILVKIFGYCATNEGNLSLFKLANVSSGWEKLIKSKCLWKCVDLVEGVENLTIEKWKSMRKTFVPLLRESKKVRLNTSIITTRWDNFFFNFPSVTEISFVGTRNLRPEVLLDIIHSKIKIESLNFDGVFLSFIPSKIIRKMATTILPSLKKLVLSNNSLYITAIEVLFKVVGQSCEQLEVLELENCLPPNRIAVPELDYSSIRRNCRSLRVLNFSFTFIDPQIPKTVYPQNDTLDLRELHMGSTIRSYRRFGDNFLLDFVGNCKNLETINANYLPNCNSLHFLQKIKAKRMKNLYICNIFNGKYDIQAITSQATIVFGRWQSTLLTLDLSRNIMIDSLWLTIFESFCKDSPLETLYLNCSNITTRPFITAIKQFTNLSYLDTSYCTNIIERSLRQKFYKEDCKKLKVNYFWFDNPLYNIQRNSEYFIDII
ncbi:unnamed protein product [Dimorphilus gyrociliatus]|uniref:F-box domain-containing protein n=1 Tax=Dimorphilus gyrociliatus TaxID=2664684 RepID=A0A7I8W3T2_9ANNE|nr:unnamed protein product [Dimorphilus gyrociliatus]